MTERVAGYGKLHPNTSASWGRARMRAESDPDPAPVDAWSRRARYSGMLGLTSLTGSTYIICGVGAIGRQVALSLATMGISKSITLVDPDVVAPENMGTQGYLNNQLGLLKADATKSDMLLRNPKMKVEAVRGMMGSGKRVGTGNLWMPDTPPDVLFLCPDDMITRKEISLRKTKIAMPTKFLIDTRMGAWACRIIADFPPFKRWKPTLFADSAAFSGACTLQSTYFAASVCGGLAIAALCTMAGAVKPDSMDAIVNLLDCDISHLELDTDQETLTERSARNMAVRTAARELRYAVPGM